jgi:hypothetical protein
MRTVIVAVILLAAVATHAGTNPGVTIYVSFDQNGGLVHSRSTGEDIYTVLDAYICLGNLGGGARAVSFRLNNLMEEYPGVVATMSYYPLWPAG